jgi:hypothetical protein
MYLLGNTKSNVLVLNELIRIIMFKCYYLRIVYLKHHAMNAQKELFLTFFVVSVGVMSSFIYLPIYSILNLTTKHLIGQKCFTGYF